MLALALCLVATKLAAEPTLKPDQVFTNPAARDQDDMTVWRDSAAPERSLVIASDKKASRLFVYDLAGRLVQSVPVDSPGNVDARGELVVVNSRGRSTVVVLAVDRQTRRLARVDDGHIETGSGENYGLALYDSPHGSGLQVFVTTKAGVLRQFALGPARPIRGRLVREIDLGSISEGMVADDQAGTVFVAQENRGIWDVPAEAADRRPRRLIARVGDASRLVADVEGLSLYRGDEGGGVLVASSQGSSSFKLYGRAAPHAYLGGFRIAGVRATDGVHVVDGPLGPALPRGALLVHNGAATPCPVVLVRWEKVAALLPAR